MRCILALCHVCDLENNVLVNNVCLPDIEINNLSLKNQLHYILKLKVFRHWQITYFMHEMFDNLEQEINLKNKITRI